VQGEQKTRDKICVQKCGLDGAGAFRENGAMRPLRQKVKSEVPNWHSQNQSAQKSDRRNSQTEK
jgi:hypothetical protein